MKHGITRLVGCAVLVLGVGLTPSPAPASNCGKDCKTLINTEFKACKTACPKGSAGKACKKDCSTEKKADGAACKAAANPTPPNCGGTDDEGSTTTTTTTMSTTTTTLTCNTEPAAFAGITAQHNSTRATATPTPTPPLADLCWNNVVAGHGQTWANNCSFSHDPGLGTLGEGQNIYAEGAMTGFPPMTAHNAEPAWASEAANYDYATNTCATGQVCGHYTQVVWRSTQFFGCGLMNCTTNSPFGPSFPNWTLVVCNYQPPGNVVGQRPY